jgi:pentatricopeptide repeat protein
LLKINKPDKWNLLKNEQFLDVLAYLVESKHAGKQKNNNTVRKFWFSRLPTEIKGKDASQVQIRKIPEIVMRFLCKSSQYDKALKLIEQLMTKKVFLNDPILYHYKIITKMLEIQDSPIKEMEMKKLMIESSGLLTKQASLFNTNRDMYYIENNMLFLNELKEQNNIKTFYLRMKIPAEHYSIRVAPLLIK